MSLTAFLQQFVKPSRWWRRRRTIEITVWPRSFAQALCPHSVRQMIMFDVEAKTKTGMCRDCHKHIEEPNNCIHSNVKVCMMETVGTQLLPRSYTCDLCGVELEPKDLPKDVQIAYVNLK